MKDINESSEFPTSVVSDSVRPHRRQPTRLCHPWDSPGKNTGAGCHFLLQCMKVKNENEVAQSCPTLRNSMDCSLPGCSIHGIFQARVLEWGAIAFSMEIPTTFGQKTRFIFIFLKSYHSAIRVHQTCGLRDPPQPELANVRW